MEDPTKFFESEAEETPVFIDSSNEDTFIEDEIGLQLSHLLAIGGLFLAILLVISLLWNYCAGEEQPSAEEPANEPKKSEQVMVAEVRPGLIVIRGSPTSEETFRILQEYDSLTNNPRTPHHDSPYYGSTVAAQPRGLNMYGGISAPMAAPPMGPHPVGSSSRGTLGDRQLIDLDLEAEVRPPPYAPPFPQSQTNP